MLIHVDTILDDLEKAAQDVERWSTEFIEIAPNLAPEQFATGYADGVRFAKYLLERRIELELQEMSEKENSEWLTMS